MLWIIANIKHPINKNINSQKVSSKSALFILKFSSILISFFLFPHFQIFHWNFLSSLPIVCSTIFTAHSFIEANSLFCSFSLFSFVFSSVGLFFILSLPLFFVSSPIMLFISYYTSKFTNSLFCYRNFFDAPAAQTPLSSISKITFIFANYQAFTFILCCYFPNSWCFLQQLVVFDVRNNQIYNSIFGLSVNQDSKYVYNWHNA